MNKGGFILNYKIFGIIGIALVVLVLVANSFASTTSTTQNSIGGWKTVYQNTEMSNCTNNGFSCSFSTLEKVPYTDLNILSGQMHLRGNAGQCVIKINNAQVMQIGDCSGVPYCYQNGGGSFDFVVNFNTQPITEGLNIIKITCGNGPPGDYGYIQNTTIKYSIKNSTIIGTTE